MQGLDLALFNSIHRFWGLNRALDHLGTFIANVLAYLMVAGMFVFAFYSSPLFYERLFILSEIFIVFFVSRFLIAGSISVLVGRKRPFVTLGFKPAFVPLTSGAFPSGHMSGLFAMSLVLLAYSTPWGMAYLALSFLVGLGRIFVGVHWPSDIIAGILVGLTAGVLAQGLVLGLGPRMLSWPAIIKASRFEVV